MQAPNITLLVIDDSPSNALVFRHCAKRMDGYRVTVRPVVYSASPTGPPLVDEDADVIILNHQPPGVRMLDVLRTLRAKGEQRPIIVVSQGGDEQLVAEVMREGADDYLLRSNLSPASLRHAIHGALARRRAEVAQRENERLRIVHEMTVLLSHEINNPLQAIIMATEATLQQSEIDDKGRERLSRVLAASERIADLVERLRRLKRVTSTSYVGSVRMVDLSHSPPRARLRKPRAKTASLSRA